MSTKQEAAPKRGTRKNPIEYRIVSERVVGTPEEQEEAKRRLLAFIYAMDNPPRRAFPKR